MNKKKHCLTLGIAFTTLLMIVLVCIFFLNKVDKAQAKVTVYAAFSDAYDEFVNSDKDITKFFEIYGEEKFCHSGNLVLYETKLLNNKLINLIKNIPIEYSVICRPYDGFAAADITLLGYHKSSDKVHSQTFINDEKIVFKIDEIYDGYLMIPNNDIKERFNESLWYSLLGDVFSMIPDNYSLDIYPEGMTAIKEPVVSGFLKEYEYDGTLNELLNGITIKKADEQKSFFIEEAFVIANAYEITVSKSLSNKLLDIVSEYSGIEKEKLFAPGKFSFTAYISDDSKLRGISALIPAKINKKECDIELFVSFKAKDSVFEKVLVEAKFLMPENENYTIKALINNTGIGNDVKTSVIVSMHEPYISRLLELEAVRDSVTNEITVDMAVDISGLSGRISYKCAPYEEEIIMPENVLEMYELNLWQILNIYSDADWSFIK